MHQEKGKQEHAEKKTKTNGPKIKETYTVNKEMKIRAKHWQSFSVKCTWKKPYRNICLRLFKLPGFDMGKFLYGCEPMSEAAEMLT